LGGTRDEDEEKILAGTRDEDEDEKNVKFPTLIGNEESKSRWPSFFRVAT
jgi:hypothetical protein